MIKTELLLEGEPIPLQRHRTTVKNGKQQQFDPQAKRKVVIRNILFHRLKDPTPCKKEVSIILKFYFYRPPSMRGKTNEDLEKISHIRKPDLDNCIKFILDCGNGILWKDDSLISEIYAFKAWSNHPRTEIEYYELSK